MATFLISFIVIALAIFGMACGVLMGRKPIAGSCGGLNRLGLGCRSCEPACAKGKGERACSIR